MDDERTAALVAAKAHREKEVMFHQINIYNYSRAIDRIDSVYSTDDTLKPFRAQLKDLLAASILEQKKERILLEVINQQINEG